MDIPASEIKPIYRPKSSQPDSPAIQQTINILGLIEHLEGGFFVETDRDSRRVPNPFLNSTKDQGYQLDAATAVNGADDSTRSASTTIHYFLTPKTSVGAFHRNKGRTVHTLHSGRGRYVIIHPDEVGPDGKARIESFVVGHNLAAGERLQWIVEGGKFKSSYLLPDTDEGKETQGLLISEVNNAC